MLKSAVHLLCLVKRHQWCQPILVPLAKYATQNSKELADAKQTLGEKAWQNSITKLQQLGFSDSESASMLFYHPSLSRFEFNKLEHQQQVLYSLGLKTNEAREMIAREPRLLTQNPRLLRKNHLFIMGQLGGHHGGLAVVNSPNILIDSCFSTQQKIDYCIMEMWMSKSSIAKSKILSCPFLLIRTRHTLAYRCGLYKKIDAKNKDGLPSNPSVADLFFSSDEAFLKRLKGITQEEYTIFETMIAAEEEEQGYNLLEEEEGDKDDALDDDRLPNDRKTSHRRSSFR